MLDNNEHYSKILASLKEHHHFGKELKIEYIKAVRKDTGFGLKDCKEFVESYLHLSDSTVGDILKASKGPYMLSSPVIHHDKVLVVPQSSQWHPILTFSTDEAKRFIAWAGRSNVSCKTYVEKLI